MAAAFPEFTQLGIDMGLRDWPAVETFFGQLVNWDDKVFAVWQVAEVPNGEVFLYQLVEEEPAAILPRVLLAGALISRGWAIRSTQRAQHVSREQFAAFHEHLRGAEEVLIDATARAPEDVSAWTLRLVTARGLELGQAEARRRYDQAAKHHPSVYAAQTQLLQQLCPKWSGTFEAMHAFARDCAASSAPGGLSPTLVVEAHLERWLELESGKDTEYLRQPEVLEEIRLAASQSVWHPDFHSRYGWLRAHNQFAMVFSVVGDYASAVPHFRALGHLATESPWQYLGAPVPMFEYHRAKALAT